jgi:hypothetical protein
MIRLMFSRLLLSLLTFALAGPAWAATSPIALKLTMPAQATDDRATLATVELKNVSGKTIRVLALTRASLVIDARSIADAGTGKCRSYNTAAAIGTALETVPLPPGGVIRATVDIAGDQPFGLRPGRYEITARYDDESLGIVRSPASPFTLTVPEGPGAAAYREFLDVCAAVQAFDANAQERAVSFVRAHPDFHYARAIAFAAASAGGTDAASKLVQFLSERFPNAWETTATVSVQAQAIETARVAAEKERHLVAYRAALDDPRFADSAAAKRQLGTILDAEAFVKHEEFLQRYPDSPFAPEVLYGMIEAVGRGVRPRGQVSSEEDTILTPLYSRLVKNYGDSYRARQVLRNPRVKRLLEAAATE